MIKRVYDLAKKIKPNKAVIILGPRRTGKTTLLNQFLANTKLKYKLALGDEITVQQALSTQDLYQLKNFIGPNEMLIIDEAQKIPNIGLNLKIIIDNIPGIYVVATGSSSFDLAGQIGEPLVGRKISLFLYPISQLELTPTLSPFDLTQKLPEWLVFGSYPQVIESTYRDEKIEILNEIVNSYLLKDILELERVKGAKALLDLLRLIAFQIGNEVSLSELSREAGLDFKTVSRYLDLFEKTFILYNLRGYSRNLRSELNRKSKYYFLDNGIRNAVISQYNDLVQRNDIGVLWENFLVSERLKTQAYLPIYSGNYFWRTWEGKEIDWVEEREGGLFAWEFKWSPQKKSKNQKTFLAVYPNAILKIITSENYLSFVTEK
ncbi:ATP-binding protein [Candidatus Gottesmanbacteria bacterium]|nr:ATP-binding protein [Candidatus Gottesmanbacteria bacterium]